MFVDSIEFRNGEYTGVNSGLKVRGLAGNLSGLVQRNLAVYVLQRDSKLLELRSKLEATPSELQGE
jgi:hypothetical protein